MKTDGVVLGCVLTMAMLACAAEPDGLQGAQSVVGSSGNAAPVSRADGSAGTSAAPVGMAERGGTLHPSAAAGAPSTLAARAQPGVATAAVGGSSAAGTRAAGSAGSEGSAGSAAASAAAAGASGSAAAAGSGASTAGSAAMLKPATVFIAGDSTVMTYTTGELEGWGQELGQFFDDRISIDNQAIGGRSVAYFMYEVETNAAGDYQCTDSQGTPKFRLDASGKRIDTARWSKIKNGMHAGDFLLIQFGHNDETHTCPRYVSTQDYARELGNMAEIAHSKGATAIFVTPMGHRAFDGATVRKTLVDYANAMREAGEQQGVEIVDLNSRSFEYYMTVGDSYLAKNIFDGGTTHFVKAGAIKMAELIVGELKAHASPLAAYLE